MKEKVAVATLITSLLGGCSLTETLPNDLELVELWGSTFAIVKDNEFVVSPDVVRLSCTDEKVVGYVGPVESPPKGWRSDAGSRQGYFVLDPVSGKLLQGLSPSEFSDQMEAMKSRLVEPEPIETLTGVVFGISGC
jgi:hypothetical protein